MFKMLYTPGVAHLSYMVGDGGQAAVIDPRRDVEEYIKIADREGTRSPTSSRPIATRIT